MYHRLNGADSAFLVFPQSREVKCFHWTVWFIVKGYLVCQILALQVSYKDFVITGIYCTVLSMLSHYLQSLDNSINSQFSNLQCLIRIFNRRESYSRLPKLLV